MPDGVTHPELVGKCHSIGDSRPIPSGEADESRESVVFHGVIQLILLFLVDFIIIIYWVLSAPEKAMEEVNRWTYDYLPVRSNLAIHLILHLFHLLFLVAIIRRLVMPVRILIQEFYRDKNEFPGTDTAYPGTDAALWSSISAPRISSSSSSKR